jgi:hypothetical protein
MTSIVKLGFGIVLLSLSISNLWASDDAITSKEIKKRNLDTFGLEIFEEKLDGLEGGSHRVQLSAILRNFGKPTKTKTELEDYRDPSSDGPFQYEVLTWYYDGLVLEMGSPIITVESTAPREAWIQRVTISSPRYALANGLRIGKPVSEFVDTLGEPINLTRYSVMYDVDNEVVVEPGRSEVTPYQITMGVDQAGNVSSIEWTWWWH